MDEYEKQQLNQPDGPPEKKQPYIDMGGFRLQAPYRGFSSMTPKTAEKHDIMRSVSAAGLTMLLYLFLSKTMPSVVVTSASQLYHLAGGSAQSLPPAIYQLALMVASVIRLVLPAFLLYCMQGTPYHLRSLARKPNQRLTLAALALVLGVAIVSSLGLQLLESTFNQFGVYVLKSNLVLPQTPVLFVLFLVSSVAIPAVLEEFLFRGILLHGLRKHGDAFALLLSSALFAVIHPNILAVVNAFLLGIVIGYFVLRTGSLVTGIILHGVNNATTILIAGIDEYLPSVLGNAVVNIFYLLVLTGAVTAFIFIIVKDRRAFALIEQQSLYSTSKKLRYAVGNVFILVTLFLFLWGLLPSFMTL